jgi:glutathione transport system ATP-binding protein
VSSADTTDDFDSAAPLLRVRDLTVSFPTPEGVVHAVNGIDFDVRSGETLAIVGESGSGKSVTALAVMGLLPTGSRVSGSVELRGRQLVGLKQRQLREIRGRDVAMVFQDALTSLDPVFTVGKQIVEAIRAHHRNVDGDEARERAIGLLEIVGIGSPRRRIDAFPHQLSGGMRQRVMIAIAIANSPSLLIADEPTTALDVTIQAQVMAALEAARQVTGAAMVLITHDLGLVAEYADRVHVMYGGLTFEAAPTEEIFANSCNPYTRGLMRSIPRTDQRLSRLQLIRGSPPNALAERRGCVFQPRCDDAAEVCCDEDPGLHSVRRDHLSRCHFAESLASIPVAVTLGAGHDGRPAADAGEPLLVVEHLVKEFPIQRGPLRSASGSIRAVNDVSLTIAAEESVGIVGESGSGKSTLARCILRMIEPTSGSVRFAGTDVIAADRAALRTLRARMQLVFQDPYASLNPRMTVSDIIAEPLRVHGWNRADTRRRVAELLDAVGLLPGSAKRYPHEFSGGQRQRIGIARSLALRPSLLILDEPVSALDVSVQAQVLNMLDELQSEFEVAYMYIAHDLAVVRHVADRIGVMYLGEIVEWADGDAIFEHPAHPYTQSLLAAVPVPDPLVARSREKIVIGGDVPDPSRVPSGCPFHPRCPSAQDVCHEVTPPRVAIDDGHWATCHFAIADGDKVIGQHDLPLASFDG